MKKSAILLLLLCLFSGCDVKLEAQSFPVDVLLLWDPPAASEGVTGYRVTLDGVALPVAAASDILAVACPDGKTPSCMVQKITLQTAGRHTVALVALTEFAESDPFLLTIAASKPSTPTSVRIKKP